MALSAGPRFRPVSEMRRKKGGGEGEREREEGGEQGKRGPGVFSRSLWASRGAGRTLD